MKNMKPSLFGKMLLLCAALLAAGATHASGTVTNYVGGCAGSPNFSTITAALATSPAPNVVEVCPGTYAEQILIASPVKLEGIFTSNADQIVIAVPSGGLSISNVCSETMAQPVQVCVNYAGTVDITNVAVDGSGAVKPIGIFYLASSGTLNQVETRFQEGYGYGMGIGFLGDANTVTLENSNLHDFDGLGIWVENNETAQVFTATIKGNTLVPDATASFGIWTSGGKSVTISGNSIDGPATPSCTAAGCAGIRVYQTALAGSISENKVFGVGSGGAGITILQGAGTMSVTSNTVFDIAGDGIQLYTTGVPVTGNNIMQVQNGINFECNVDSGATSNTLTAIHSVGIANVPSGAVPVNYVYDAPMIYSTCP